MKMEIRRLLPGDDALVMRVAEDVFDEPVRPDRLAAYLASPGHFMIVALADGVVVGQCAAVIHRHPDKVSELYIDEVGVAPAFQRQGTATRMLDAMFALGREHGCEEAWVGTEPDNVAARALYEARREPHGEAEGFVMYVYRL
ncbi:GNAT family N-acetyltransferase [Mesorhizobium mediterraneum]|uniref:GNAT family N-acetyltransferase n=1 Tax=Mesorhizobium mediterraneum TaxID=43617 RepID=A0AB36RDL3_9HYPH|nr:MULTISPECIES: GNAT family N-acetyltransferase [Mesorhizobium]RUU48406.1 GNAT family N-acetyltransferase [Mesorhizobium sp. M6A.T.Ca.TU.002.02.2.1]AZO65407.1 GNAT family N-acetyltransferase [Mesorhizobium sp. M6A.T.Cr.TU.016.01.1.1]PAQ02274.1 GNAT family N-acetyltransferase [Mesorhizobium mediterraneum]RUU98547.1 GNAT family N-acetyltransferase [Mesorhizobium sp. M6A.T.Cr.TU.017.01.1.1]RVB73915.1 GNAT family N-acetyltransferase [Mesorhizobium sp. M6A.T.Cr.TU.014.01.1.1]